MSEELKGKNRSQIGFKIQKYWVVCGPFCYISLNLSQKTPELGKYACKNINIKKRKRYQNIL